MLSTTVRVSEPTRSILRELAEKEGTTMNEVLDRAVRRYQRLRLFEEADAFYDSLRGNPSEWEEELAERKLWESTLGDGLK